MSGMLRELLSERADAAGSPGVDLHHLIAQGERRVRRRRVVALGGTAAAVALTLGASFVVVETGDDRTSPPVDPSTNNPTRTADVEPDAPGSRPLTYGLGATIHYGDRTIETAEDADGLFVLDDGLAILTGDDPPKYDNRLFITEGGSDPIEIAHRVRQLTSGEVGSLLAWLDGGDVVIYDIQVRGVVARVAVRRQYSTGFTVLENAVYWHEYTEGTVTTDGREDLVRYDVPTGTRTLASAAELRAETRTAVSPVLVVGSADSLTPAEGFTVVDSQLEFETDAQGVAPPVFVRATGERLRVGVPDGYDGELLSVFQWLDDDRFAVVAEGGVKRAPVGDLLVCRISAGQCRTVATGEQYWLLPAGLTASVGGED
jgi:hypothetical protein